MKKGILLLLVILLAGCGNPFGSAEFEKEDYKKIAEANNRFSFDLLKELNNLEGEQNLFFSPISIHMALSMTYNGAAGKTREEMADVLYVQDMKLEELNQANASFLSKTLDKDFKSTLKIANSLWIQKGYPFLEDFIKSTKDYYLAEFQEKDFSSKKTIEEINHWVDKKTEGNIKDLINEIRPNTVGFLINAIYFKGDWEYPFDEKETYTGDFILENGKTKKHSFMTQTGHFHYYEDDLLQGIELPYKNKELSMVIFLPKEGKSLDEVHKLLSFEQWNSWLSQFQEKEGRIDFPKFTMDYSVTLNDPLIQLGMPTALSDQADFSKMVDGGGVMIDEVLHKSFIEVNEKGTKASGATAVIIKETAVAIDTFTMTVNRPFFFAIKDNESGMILFLGEVYEPTLKN